jgi:hypothetical protein
LHIINPKAISNSIHLNDFPYQLKKASHFESGENIKFSNDKKKGEISLSVSDLNMESIDQVIVLEIKK